MVFIITGGSSWALRQSKLDKARDSFSRASWAVGWLEWGPPIDYMMHRNINAMSSSSFVCRLFLPSATTMRASRMPSTIKSAKTVDTNAYHEYNA
eukprot:1370199-Amorphochlora_amoeboformis.AAC.1